MSALSDKMRRAREMRVPAGKHTFIVLRPTRLDHAEKFVSGNAVRAVLGQIVGWDGVTEGDLVNGGDPHPVPFDAEACAEWLADRPDLFDTIATALVDGVKQHLETLDRSLKN